MWTNQGSIILDMCTYINIGSMYVKQKLTKLNWEIEKSTIIAAKDLTTLFKDKLEQADQKNQ